MKRLIALSLLLLLAAPAFASTHKFPYDTPCNELWRAVKDTLRNSGKYGIISIDNAETTASYNIGGNLTGKRMNTALLVSTGAGKGCELQVQTAFSGLVNNDAGDLKKRVDESLTKLKNVPLEPTNGGPEKSEAAAQTSATIESSPTGADIEIDGNFIGSTPSTVNLTPGAHEITVKKKGFADWTRKLNVTGGAIHLNAELEKAATL
jgi:hypothetical protein